MHHLQNQYKKKNKVTKEFVGRYYIKETMKKQKPIHLFSIVTSSCSEQLTLIVGTESPVNLTRIFLECGRKPENTEKPTQTQKDPQLKFHPGISSCEATDLSTVLLQKQKHSHAKSCKLSQFCVCVLIPCREGRTLSSLAGSWTDFHTCSIPRSPSEDLAVQMFQTVSSSLSFSFFLSLLKKNHI